MFETYSDDNIGSVDMFETDDILIAVLTCLSVDMFERQMISVKS